VDGASSRLAPFRPARVAAGLGESLRFLTTIRCSVSSALAAAAAGRLAPATSTPSSIGDPQRSLGFERRPSFITNFIEAETHALLLRKLGRAIAREWLLTGGLTVVPALPAEEQKAKEILARHTDKDWTLCDAISFAVLDARHVARAFTFDHHFQQYGRIQVLGLKG